MAIDVQVPVSLTRSSADYVSEYSPATIYLEYDAASTFDSAPGTATTNISASTDRYEFYIVGVEPNYWYRYRIGDGSTYNDYSAPFQLPRAYATIQEVVRGREFPDTSREDELDELLLSATEWITTYACGGRSFFRDPVGSGTTTKTFDITNPHQSVLSLAREDRLDITSITSVSIADYSGDTYTAISSGASGYYTVPDYPKNLNHGTTWPYTDIVLSDQGTTHTTFPTGRRIVQIEGVFGWAYIPEMVRRATIDLVRFWWDDRGRSGEPVGMSAFGAPIFGPGLPKSVRDLMRSDYAWKDYVA